MWVVPDTFTAPAFIDIFSIYISIFAGNSSMMERLLKFYAAAAAHGNIGKHVVYTGGTSVRVNGASNNIDAVIAADRALELAWETRVPVETEDGFYMVVFAPLSLHVFTTADTAESAVALATSALAADAKNKDVLCIVHEDLQVHMALPAGI